jgi:hypothetical protein
MPLADAMRLTRMAHHNFGVLGLLYSALFLPFEIIQQPIFTTSSSVLSGADLVSLQKVDQSFTIARESSCRSRAPYIGFSRGKAQGDHALSDRDLPGQGTDVSSENFPASTSNSEDQASLYCGVLPQVPVLSFHIVQSLEHELMTFPFFGDLLFEALQPQDQAFPVYLPAAVAARRKQGGHES